MGKGGQKTTDNKLEGSRGCRKDGNRHVRAKQSLQLIRTVPAKSLPWLVTLPRTQERTFSTKGGTAQLSHSYSRTIQREEGAPDSATCVTQAGKTLPPARLRHTYIPATSWPPAPYTPPPGGPRPWLDTPLWDKAEQS